MRTILSLLLFCLLPATAEERILSYDSEIRIGRDGSLDVTETIRVSVEGIDIKRGIYRDFPQSYKTKWGLRQVRPFEVTKVTRNGIDEPFRVEKMGSGTRVWIGNSEVILPAGSEQQYALNYRTSGQLFHDEKGDELYWNATGNHWIFPIEEATAKVILPEGIGILTAEAYTGAQSAKERGYEVSTDGNTAAFNTTSSLAVQEGLTVVVRWEKGKLDPSVYRKRSVMTDNLPLFVGLFLVGGGLLAFLVFWNRNGRDPSRGVIIARWEPPLDMSPAGVRYLKRMGFDNTCFSSAVIGLAAKGGATIKEQDKRTFELVRKDSPADLLPEEKRLYDDLLGSSPSLLLHQVNHVEIGKARTNLQAALANAYRGVLFKNNYGLWWIAVLVCAAGMCLGALQADDFFAALIVMSVVCVITAILVLLVKTTFNRLQSDRYIPAVLWTVFTFIVLCFLSFGMFMVWVIAGAILTLAMAVALAFASVFLHLLKAPSKAGRKTLDEIEGFREYLSVAEEDRLNLENPPEKTPALFEKFLPYALALGVEQKWSEKFADILSNIREPGNQGTTYTPAFYSGSSGNFGNALGGAAFASALTGALASSATAPSSSGSSDGSSSGGGGGGGSSGGGGGGGGGGGW